MSDEPRDPEDESVDDEAASGEEGSEDLLPADDKGLGLTEEFARIEAEIDAEIGRTGDPLAGAEPGDEEDDDVEDKPAIRWDDDDSEEWVVPPLAQDPEGGGTEEWATPVEAEAEEPPPAEELEPSEEPESSEEPAEPPVAQDPPTVIRPAGAADEDEAVAAEAPVDDSATEHTVVRPRPLVPIGAGAGGGGGEYIPDEELANTTPRLWWRFMTGSVLIVAAVATAVALSSLLFLTDVAAQLQPIPGLADKLAKLDPGAPQTILIVGSDKRSDTPGDPGRSDTTMLLRVDAEHDNLSLFSLPRDLKVDIAGRNFSEAKLNEAYTDGGIKKTLETVKALTGLEINHVVNVDFQGFADAVDAIGCVYVDVDRKYFHSNDGLYGDATYSEIDINAGYQRLCGEKALEYVRYRHTDTDFVRAARQQDFLRNARHQVPVGEVLPIIGGDTGSDLLNIFTKYTSSDIKTPADVIGVLKAFLGVKDVPIKEVHFEGSDTIEDGIAYVTTTPEQMKKAVDEFLGEKDSAGSRGGSSANQKPPEPKSSDQAKQDQKKADAEKDSGSGADVISTDDIAAATGVDKFSAFGRTSARRLKFPVYVPTAAAPGSTYDGYGSRQYEIKDEDDNEQPAYKMVIQLANPAVNDEYYGVEGTTWEDPPILKDPSDTVTVDDRDYDLYYDGDRLRMVAFHVDGNSYWVSNTLLQTLDESQMMAIAESMQEAHG
jgi:LCP family protein required for cell wall assembly